MKTFSLILAALAIASVTANSAVVAAGGNATAAAAKHGGSGSDSSDEYGSKAHGGSPKAHGKGHSVGSMEDSHEEYGSKAHGSKAHGGKHGKHAKVGSMDDSHEEYGSKAGAKSKANVTVPTPAPKSGAAGSLAGVVGASAVVATAVAASLL